MRKQITSYELLRQMIQNVPGADACLDSWPRRKQRRGYVTVWTPSQRIEYAHRISYELARGPIPEGLVVCHKCDNPGCFRPDHLFLGTQLDNLRDCVSKGRNVRGAKTCSAKLTEDNVREIRGMQGSGLFQREIAARFGVSLTIVNQILNGHRWKHLM